MTAVVRDPDSQEVDTVYADYLVAADGVHSPVREALGVPTAGYGRAADMWFRLLPRPVARVYRRPRRRRRGEIENPRYKGYSCLSRRQVYMFITTYHPAKGETVEQFTRSAVEG